MRSSETTRTAVLNGACGVADYISQPLGMLLAAPFLLHRLGLAQYGLWMIASAVVGSGGLISTGFSDMTVKYVSMYRARADWDRVNRVVQCSLVINLALGTLIAVSLWFAAPFAGRHVFKVQPELQTAFLWAIRIGSAILLVRSLDSIFVSTLRAYEKYRPAVQITVGVRALTIVSAVVLAALGYGMIGIMLATLVISAGGMLFQAVAVRLHVGPVALYPLWNRELLPAISAFGCFSWLQSLSGIIFGQADKLIVGALLGSSAVAYYSVCTQAAQPVHGLVASGFNFLFPHLSARHATGAPSGLSRIVADALYLNIALVTLLCLPLVIFNKILLTWWMGPSFAAQASSVLGVVAVSYGLVGFNVTGHYALMALGAIRYVTFLNLVAGIAMIGAIAFLALHFGLIGAAVGRLVYGPVTWLVYYKICQLLPLNYSEQGVMSPSFAVVSEKI